jgi:hypothetical protein
MGQNGRQYFHAGQLYDAELVFQNGLTFTDSAKSGRINIGDSDLNENVKLVYNKSTSSLDTIKFFKNAKLAYSFFFGFREKVINQIMPPNSELFTIPVIKEVNSFLF